MTSSPGLPRARLQRAFFDGSQHAPLPPGPSAQPVRARLVGRGLCDRRCVQVRTSLDTPAIPQSVYPSPRPVGLQSAFVRPFSSTSLCMCINGGLGGWEVGGKPLPFAPGPHHLLTLGGVDSLEVGLRGHRGPSFWKPRCAFPEAWAPDLGLQPDWLAWHCCSPVGKARPRPPRGWGGGGEELADAVGTDYPEKNPGRLGKTPGDRILPASSHPSSL